jgi:hypothetical protein
MGTISAHATSHTISTYAILSTYATSHAILSTYATSHAILSTYAIFPAAFSTFHIALIFLSTTILALIFITAHLLSSTTTCHGTTYYATIYVLLTAAITRDTTILSAT